MLFWARFGPSEPTTVQPKYKIGILNNPECWQKWLNQLKHLITILKKSSRISTILKIMAVIWSSEPKISPKLVQKLVQIQNLNLNTHKELIGVVNQANTSVIYVETSYYNSNKKQQQIKNFEILFLAVFWSSGPKFGPNSAQKLAQT